MSNWNFAQLKETYPTRKETYNRLRSVNDNLYLAIHDSINFQTNFKYQLNNLVTF